jgi:hypothetical protein
LRRATSASQSTPKSEQGSGDAEGEEIMTRTHRAFRIDMWTDDDKEVVEHLADVEDLTLHWRPTMPPGSAGRAGPSPCATARMWSRTAAARGSPFFFPFRGLTSRSD